MSATRILEIASELGDIVSDMDKESCRARSEAAFWKEQFIRARCGCFTLDCGVHGAYETEKVNRVEIELRATHSASISTAPLAGEGESNGP